MRIIKALLKNFKLSFHHENEGTYTIVLPLDIILCASKHHYLQYLKKNVRYLSILPEKNVLSKQNRTI